MITTIWSPLRNGNTVELVAPSSGVSNDDIEKSKEIIRDWGLVPRLRRQFWNPDKLYSGSDQERFEELWSAIDAKDSKAIWCVRGGAGASRILTRLLSQTPPGSSKIFIGFSDATCLELFLAEKWGWIPIHGPNLSQIANNTVDSESIRSLKELLFGRYNGVYLNDLSLINDVVDGEIPPSTIIGGNLSLIQASIGTFWQPKTSHRVMFLEDIGLRVFQIVEKLDHLHQTGLLNQVAAMVLGEFVGQPQYTMEMELLEEALLEFAQRVNIPVFRTSQIGHGKRNITILNGGLCHITREKHSWSLSVMCGGE